MSTKLINNEYEAKDALYKEFPFFEIDMIVEYKDYYVFGGEPGLLGLLAVNKNTGKVRGFNPTLPEFEDFFEVTQPKSLSRVVREDKKTIELERVLK